MENIILQTHGISVKYGNFLALNDVSIHLKNKHIYGFIGENGAGKTTLMRVLTGLLYPTSGAFSLFGKNESSDILKMRRHIAAPLKLQPFIQNTPLTVILNYSASLSAIPTRKYAISCSKWWG